MAGPWSAADRGTLEDPYRLELKPEVADPGEQAVHVGLVDQGSDEVGGAVAVGHVHAVEAGRNTVAEPAVDGDTKGAVRAHDRDDRAGLGESTSPGHTFTQARMSAGGLPGELSGPEIRCDGSRIQGRLGVCEVGRGEAVERVGRG